MELMKNVELDKICRICLQEKREMRPLFAEMISEMLMECVSIKVSKSTTPQEKTNKNIFNQ